MPAHQKNFDYALWLTEFFTGSAKGLKVEIKHIILFCLNNRLYLEIL